MSRSPLRDSRGMLYAGFKSEVSSICIQLPALGMQLNTAYRNLLSISNHVIDLQSIQLCKVFGLS